MQGNWSISYVLNDDEANPAQNAESNPAEYNIESAVTLADPERRFYEFAGWYGNADFSSDYMMDWYAGVVTGDVKLYAKWAVTCNSISAAIEAGATEIKLAGKISEDEIDTIAVALRNNSGTKLTVDLSGTTGAEEIPVETFKDCANLAGFVFPASVTRINSNAFENSGLESIVIPGTVKTICNNAFSNCISLSALTIEDGVETIEFAAFSNCSALKDVTVPASVKKLDSDTFRFSGLETATVYAETVGDSAFQYCGSLKKVIFGEGVKEIVSYVFDMCYALEEVALPATLESIGKDTFSGTLRQLSTVKYGGSTTEWKVAIGDNNDALLNVPIYCTDGIAITADKAAELITKLESGTWENHNTYTIKIISKELTSENLTDIKNALSNNSLYKLFNIDLTAAIELKEITESAFQATALIGITLPNSIESIGTNAFYTTMFEKIVIPDSVKTIGNGAFRNCYKLTEITLPASLTSIGIQAFSQCDMLETVYYKGTQAQWEAIDISTTGNDKLTGAKIICSDGIINGE